MGGEQRVVKTVLLTNEACTVGKGWGGGTQTESSDEEATVAYVGGEGE
jgi:hypothetical protein